MSMPNFLVIGAAKSGTTALLAYVQQHPQIFTSPIKETGFFALEGETACFAGPGDEPANERYITDLDKYQALFRRVNGELAVGEQSDIYLSSPKAPARIRHYLPHAKLIAVLRNPVDRAYSAYRHMVRNAREPLSSFEEALEADDARVAANWNPIWHLKSRGFYYQQLKRYFDLFGRDQLAIYTYDEFEANPLGTVQDIFRFLGVDPTFAPDVSVRHNVGGTPKSRLLHKLLVSRSGVKDAVKRVLPKSTRNRLIQLKSSLLERNTVRTGPEMLPETRRSLIELYRDDIRKLESLIDRDLSHWLVAEQKRTRARGSASVALD
jgi:hypothetical protein